MLIIRLTNIGLEPIPFRECVAAVHTTKNLRPGECGFLRTFQIYTRGNPATESYLAYGFGAFLRQGVPVMVMFPKTGNDDFENRIALDVIPVADDIDIAVPEQRQRLCREANRYTLTSATLDEKSLPTFDTSIAAASAGFIAFHTTDQTAKLD